MIIQQKQFVKTIYDFVYIATWIKHRSCDRFNRTPSTKFSEIHKNYNWDKHIELLMIVAASLGWEWWFVIANLAKLHSYTCLANLHNCFCDKKEDEGARSIFFPKYCKCTVFHSVPTREKAWSSKQSKLPILED